jgi:regulator of sirC expression with transglutaminase-like and TPR domain
MTEEMLTKMENKMGSQREKLVVIMKAGKEKIVAMRMACLQKAEACLESKMPTSLEIKSEAEHEEAPKGDAAVKPVGALKKRYGCRNVATGRLRKPKKRNQGNAGFQK